VRWLQYLAAERVQFSDRRPALDCAARCSARCRRSEGLRGRRPSQCWRNASCLHCQPTNQRIERSASVHVQYTTYKLRAIHCHRCIVYKYGIPLQIIMTININLASRGKAVRKSAVKSHICRVNECGMHVLISAYMSSDQKQNVLTATDAGT